MKTIRLWLAIGVFLSAISPTVHAADKYPVQFTILSSGSNAQGCSMWITDGQFNYFVTDYGLHLHCWTFKPATVMPGRFKQLRMAIGLQGKDDKGKPKEFSYKIDQKQWAQH
jgi:hypothetical protein